MNEALRLYMDYDTPRPRYPNLFNILFARASQTRLPVKYLLATEGTRAGQ